MIGATLNADAVSARLAGIPAATETALLDAAGDIADRLREAAARNLSGSVLQLRSGKLRDSLSVAVTGTGSHIAARLSDDAPYAAFQEYGFAGTENVREFLRRQTMVFGRRIPPIEVQVRAHDRRMDYKGRSYLRGALAEIAPTIRDTLAGAAAEALGS